jgi:hypothetical protein
MFFIDFFNKRVKRLNIFDVKLVQLGAMFLALILVKLIPGILAINIWWFVGLAILSMIRPIWVVFHCE